MRKLCELPQTGNEDSSSGPQAQKAGTFCPKGKRTKAEGKTDKLGGWASFAKFLDH